MECKAEIRSILREIGSKRFVMTLALDEVSEQQLRNLTDKPQRMTLVRWRNKRSLKANDYCWLLLTQIARTLADGSRAEEHYERYIQDLAPWAKDKDGDFEIVYKPAGKAPPQNDHWKKIGYIKNGTMVAYVRLLGSSEFDSKTMSEFIDVIKTDAEELGIEVATPDEIARMKALWQPEKR